MVYGALIRNIGVSDMSESIFHARPRTRPLIHFWQSVAGPSGDDRSAGQNFRHKQNMKTFPDTSGGLNKNIRRAYKANPARIQPPGPASEPG